MTTRTGSMSVGAAWVAAAVLGVGGFGAAAAQAATVIGDFEGADPGTWGYWNSGVQTPLNDDPNLELSTERAVTGTTSVKLTNSGWDQGLAYSANLDARTAFTQNHQIQFDVIFPASSASGWWETFELILNSEYDGWQNIQSTVTNSAGGTNQVGWAAGDTPERTVTFTYDYTARKTAWGANVPGWVELVFSFNNDGVHTAAYVDNVRVSSVPEPAGLAVLGLAGLATLVRRRRSEGEAA